MPSGTPFGESESLSCKAEEGGVASCGICQPGAGGSLPTMSAPSPCIGSGDILASVRPKPCITLEQPEAPIIP